MKTSTKWYVGIVAVFIIGFVFFIWTHKYKVLVMPTTNTSGQEYVDYGIYASTTLGFSIKYPKNFTVNEKYTYTAMGPGKDIHGVSFVIPESMHTGTNLSSDSYVSVEMLPKQTCAMSDFFDNVQATSTIVDNGKTYDVARGVGVGAGNYYEEVVYKLSGCTAIRYLIHSSNIMNYPEGTVTEFDRTALLAIFDKILRSYVSTK